MTGSGNAQRAAQGIYCASRRRESSSVHGGTGAAAHVRSPLPPLSLLPFKFGALSTQFARVGPHGTDSWSGRTQYIHLRCRRPLHAALRLGALLAYIVAYAYAHHHAFMLVIASSPCQQRFLASRSFPTNFVFTSLPAQFFSSFIRSLRSEFASRFSHLSRCPCCLSSVAGFRFRGCLGRHERGWNRVHEPRGNAGRRTVGGLLVWRHPRKYRWGESDHDRWWIAASFHLIHIALLVCWRLIGDSLRWGWDTLPSPPLSLHAPRARYERNGVHGHTGMWAPSMERWRRTEDAIERDRDRGIETRDSN